MLARGSRGVDVMELQLNLMKLGFNPGSSNGFYDARTEEAVMLFQKHYNLPISGIANQETMQHIYRLLKQMSVQKNEKKII